MKNLIYVFSIFLLMNFSCKNPYSKNSEETIAGILNVVKAHNKAWAELEDINKQMDYIHPNIQMIAPPYNNVIHGKDEYKNGYIDWMKHAKVHYYKEINPQVNILNNGNTAFVTYYIEMSFDYDSVTVERWEGIDFMTLVKEKHEWKIISDMYAKKE